MLNDRVGVGVREPKSTILKASHFEFKLWLLSVRNFSVRFSFAARRWDGWMKKLRQKWCVRLIIIIQTGIISIPLTNSTETEFPYYSLLINLISKSSVTAIFPVWTGEPEDELMVTHFFTFGRKIIECLFWRVLRMCVCVCVL